MSMRRTIRTLRLPLAGVLVACAFTCSAGAERTLPPVSAPPPAIDMCPAPQR